MDDHPANHGSGHETSDVTAAPVVTAGLLLLAFSGSVSLGMVLYVRLVSQEVVDPRTRTVAEEVVPPAPDSPAYPIEDWRGVRAAAEKQLTSAGWVDRSHGVVHLPIESAMRLLLQRGQPAARPQPKGAPR